MSATTVAQLLEEYCADRRTIVIAFDRIARATRKVTAVIGHVDATDRRALAGAVEHYVAARERDGARSSTIKRELIVVRAALRLAWKRGLLPSQPYIPLPPSSPPRARWLAPDEAKRLLSACGSELYTFVLLALTTGARRGAILELTWDRVDFARGTIDFRAPHPKAERRKHRAVVPMAPILHAELRRDRSRSASDRVVPASASRIERALRKAAASAGLPDVTAHVLRHTAATWMLGEAKLPLTIVSAMLGHRSSIITEQVYAHLSPDHLAPAAQALDRLLAGTFIQGSGAAL